MSNKIYLFIICIFISNLLGVGEAGAIFLLITPGAGPASLGEAQVAKADDAYASYFNPAGLAFLYDPDPSKDNYNLDLAKDNYLLDPSKDNYHTILNPNGTENNSNYDFGELYFDYGSDGLANQFEPGYDEQYNLDPNKDDFHPLTNINGTENNGNYDIGENYQDFGIDRTKNAFEFGYSLIGTELNSRLDKNEKFYDYGLDQIPSSEEVGYNPNGTEENNIFDLGENFEDTGIDSLFSKDEPGYDPKTNSDPNGDDYSFENQNGTEGNNKWDEGEKFYDYGIDGIKNIDEKGYNIDPSVDNYIDGIGTEGNNKWDEGEKFYDYGIDGIIDSLEFNYNPIFNIDPNKDNYTLENPKGTEGNNKWDLGEVFYDFGTDGIANYNEKKLNIDPNKDNLILDPNRDDYDLVSNPTGTEKNKKFDYGEKFDDFGNDGYQDGKNEEWGIPKIKYQPEGTEGNNKWDKGEQFFDFGIDGISDKNEIGYNSDPAKDNYDPINNKTGTEKNGIKDVNENFKDERVRFAEVNFTFNDSIYNFYNIAIKDEGYELKEFFNRSVKYDSIHYKIKSDNIISIYLFPKDSYKINKVKRMVSKDIEYIDLNGFFSDSLNNKWDWVDSDKNEKFNWSDTGSDGIPNPLEIGYDPILNPDPSGDNYSELNKKGKENNGIWDAGEGDWHEPFYDFGNDNIADYDEEGYLPDPFKDNYDSELNPLGTEKNNRWDPGEKFNDFGKDKKPTYNEKGIGNQEIVLMHVNWLPNLADDLYYEFLAYRKYFPDIGTFGGHFIFLNLGEQMRTDEYGNELYKFRSNMWSLALSFGTKISEYSAIGLNMKIIQQNLIDIGTGAEAGKGKSTDFAFDIGYLWKSPKFNFGTSISNIGPKIDFIDPNQADPQPTNLKMGILWEAYNDNYNKINILFDINKLLVAAYPAMDWDGDGFVGGYNEDESSISDFENNVIIGDYNEDGQLEIAHTDPWYYALVTSWLDDWYLGGDMDIPGLNGIRDGIIGGYDENGDQSEDGIYNDAGEKEIGNKKDRKFSKEFEEMVYNFGIEYWYSKYFALRGGYIYDFEGKIMVPTFGAGIRFLGYGFDFGYTAGEEGHPRANTMFFSLNMIF